MSVHHCGGVKIVVSGMGVMLGVGREVAWRRDGHNLDLLQAEIKLKEVTVVDISTFEVEDPDESAGDILARQMDLGPKDC